MTHLMELVDKNTKTISHVLKNVEERLSVKCRDMEDIFKRLEFLEVKNTISEMKNISGEIYTEQTLQKKRLVNLKTQQQELFKIKHTENKLKERKKNSISELWDDFKWPNISVIGIHKVGMEKETIWRNSNQNFQV